MNANPTIIQQTVLRTIPSLGLPPRAAILDAPCGGHAALTLALQQRGFIATGADLDPDAAAVLGPSFAKVNLDAPLPWPDHSFHAAISTEGIEHLENHFA